jgi:hypothetical protein
MLAPGTAPRETVEGGRVDRAPAPPARWTLDRREARADRRSAPAAARRDGARARDASTAGGKRFSSNG